MATIKSVVERFGVPASTIRFYEKEGFLTIPRDENGNRIFDDASLEALEAVLHYRNVGMSLENIHRLFEHYENHALSVKLLKETAVELDAKLAELEATRKFLAYKIAIHEERLREEEAGLVATEESVLAAVGEGELLEKSFFKEKLS